MNHKLISLMVIVFVTFLGIGLATTLSMAAPVYYSVTGNYYEAVATPGGSTWEQANAMAQSMSYMGVSGHLATITSQGENDFIVNNLGGPYALDGYRFGGFQPNGSPEPAGGWQWVTGEPWNYTNWYHGEPNNGYGGDQGVHPGGWPENVTELAYNCGQWNDFPGDIPRNSGFIVEYETHSPVISSSDNIWNIQVNADDRFHSNEAWLRPWRYSYDDGVGQWQGGYSYEVPWYYGPYNQSSGSVGSLHWSTDASGNLNVQTSSSDYQWHAWTYVYVDQPKTITMPCQGDCVPMVFLNYDFDHPINAYANGWSATLNLVAGENRIDITGYNQNDVYNFNFGGNLATLVNRMSSTQGPKTITVGLGGSDFTSIQAAIDHAIPGDTIIVNNGTYYENVVVNKAVYLYGNNIGNGLPVVDGHGGIAFNITANGVTLQGFNATNSSIGIYMTSNNSIITGNTACNNTNSGIFLLGACNNTVSYNTANNNPLFGINLNISSNYNTVIGNSVSFNGYGIGMAKAGENVFKNNNMTDNTYNYADFMDQPFHNDVDTSNLVDGKPIYYLTGASDLTIDSSSNAGLVCLWDCSNITVKDLTIKDNYAGIILANTSNSVVENNSVSQTNVGIGCFLSGNNTVTGNNASGNFLGIIQQWSTNLTITGNNASNNMAGIMDSGNVGDKIVSNVAYNNTVGIYVTRNNPGDVIFSLGSGSNATVCGNIISNNSMAGILDTGVGDRIVSNTVNGNNNGIYLMASNDTLVEDNEASHNNLHAGVFANGDLPSTGILVFQGFNNTVRNNNASYNYEGVMVLDGVDWGYPIPSSGNLIQGNTMYNNTGLLLGNQSFSAGLFIAAKGNNVIGNWMISNDNGIIMIRGATENAFTFNKVHNNSLYGLYVDSSNGNSIYFNGFLRNGQNLFSNNSMNAYDSPAPVTYAYNGSTFTSYMGNRWGDYSGIDSDGNGVGDTPYSVNDTVDAYPLANTVNNYTVEGMAPVPSPEPAAGWMFRAVHNHSGIYDDGGVRPVNTVTWSYMTWNNVWSSPAVVDGTVYVGSMDHNVYALYANNGTRAWYYRTDSSVWSSPAVLNGVVFVGCDDGNVYALYASNGTRAWNYTTGGGPSSPAVAGGMVIVGSLDGSVYALHMNDGSPAWKFNTGGTVGSSPAVVGGKVYVGSEDGNVYALYESNGTMVWSYPTGGMVRSSPAVINDIVYIASFDGKVYALYADNGTKVWDFTMGNSTGSSPAVAYGMVYIGSFDNNVYALYANNGTMAWNFTAGDQIRASPSVANGMVYIGSFDHRVYALYANNGTMAWSYETRDRISSCAAIADGTLFVGSWDGNLYAFGATPVTGFTLPLKLGWNLVSSPVVKDPAVNVSVFKGTNVTMVARYNVTSGGFDIYRVGKTPTAFQFDAGQGYFLYCNANTTYTIDGHISLNRSISISQGWNLIGWTNMTSSNSKTLAQGLHNATMLARFNTTTGSYDIYRVGKTPTPFEIKAGEGYFLYTSYPDRQSLFMG